MPPKVTLKAVLGKMSGEEYAFDERTTCIIGRDVDCGIRLPENDPTVSRHHCMLDINPPCVTIRDFGSMNGTYVNGEKIGQRDGGPSAPEEPQSKSPEHELAEGDTIRLGNTTFDVSIVAPAYCSACQRELSDEEARERGETNRRCAQCTQSGDEPRETVVATACAKCGAATPEATPDEHGVVLCAACTDDPFAIVDVLLDLAKSKKNEDLVAIEGYTIERELGRGGMGAVYLARHDETGENAALKVMLPNVALRQRTKDMFLREIENMKALNHKNIVRLKDHGCSHGTFFMTLEFCEGGNLHDYAAGRGGTLPVDEAMPIMFQVLDGLEYAHTALVPNIKRPDGTVGQGQGLVHRDIKPLNIFLTGSGPDMVAKVADYGLAKAFDNAGLSGQTCTGSAAGSPCFIPRQQVINYKYAKPEVDVWAAAASLYYVLTGFYPRDFPNDKDPWQATLQNAPVPVRERDQAVPERLAAVLDTALDDRPTLTFKTADELRSALKGAL
jgi:pSer/pThr/pTyr-binding forkhead associated (FHA) protein